MPTGALPRGETGIPVVVGVLLLIAPVVLLGVGAAWGATLPGASARTPPSPGAGGIPPAGPTEVQFVETGLRPGTPWWVDLAGKNQSAIGSTDPFFETDGTFSFRTGAGGYTASPSAGNLTVAGQSIVNLTVAFHIIWPGPYRVIFVADGLPAGTNWSVELEGTTNQTGQTSLVIGGLNPGTYSYHVLDAGHLSPTPSYGNVTIYALNVTVGVAFVGPPPGVPSLGPLPLTPGWEFAAFAFAVWALWVGYHIAVGIRDYLGNTTVGPSPAHRKSLKALKLAGHLAMLAVPAIPAVAIALSPGAFSLGPWVYGCLLLLLVTIFALRDVGGFGTRTGYGVYVDWEPPQPRPCWRCGRLNPGGSPVCSGCGASLDG